MKRPVPPAKPRIVRPSSFHGTQAPIIVRKQKKSSGSLIALLILLTVGTWMGYELTKLPKQVVTEKAATAPVNSGKSLETPPKKEVAVKETPTPSAAIAAPDKPLDLPVVPAEESHISTEADQQVSAIVARLKTEPLLILLGGNVGISHEVARDNELLTKTAGAGAWDEYRDFLSRSLASALGTVDVKSLRVRGNVLWKKPIFYEAFLRWNLLERFSAKQIEHNRYAKDLFTWMLTNPEAMEETLLTVQPGDDKERVASIMADAWLANPEKAKKYFNLMLACGVVFDKEITPQPLQESASSAPQPINPQQRYLWYVEKSERGKLATSINRLTARDLVWVICAPVEASELDWAVDKMQLNRSKWESSYYMIEYLMERAVKGLNPYKEYSFAEILKEGGICGDQSYFCVNTARALGIPAIGISGETDSGGHAWAAVKIKDDEWTTQIGRISGSSNGNADNPQVGGQTSEQEIWLWNDRAQQSRLTTLEAFRFLWLADLLGSINQTAAADESVRIANLLGRTFLETWVKLEQVLARKTKASSEPGAPAILEIWTAFVADMRKEFKENPRMAILATKAEVEHIFPFMGEGDARRTLSRERRNIKRNSGEQMDLAADALKREADLILSKGSPGATKEISQLYDRALRDYGGSITGFKKMAEDYFAFAQKEPESSRKAARDIELAFYRVVESGSKDYFRAGVEASIYKMICGYYRTAGDEAKAAKLEKRHTRLMKRAERGAL